MSARTVGFIGLGIMGVPVATNLVNAGVDVVVWARTPGPVAELVAAGARAADDLPGVFDAAGTVIRGRGRDSA
ncbi:NAD(P)-binding domain-containing protein [Micromonospora sp. NPDC005254]|uniref:NAD(P)-binding domain-containing protein n=1 Tax=Micromonospora sp. NPDC005254 TaxID=3364229 RepID=UPI0036B13D07